VASKIAGLPDQISETRNRGIIKYHHSNPTNPLLSRKQLFRSTKLIALGRLAARVWPCFPSRRFGGPTLVTAWINLVEIYQ
jgi:hypothetical protein